MEVVCKEQFILSCFANGCLNYVGSIKHVCLSGCWAGVVWKGCEEDSLASGLWWDAFVVDVHDCDVSLIHSESCNAYYSNVSSAARAHFPYGQGRSSKYCKICSYQLYRPLTWTGGVSSLPQNPTHFLHATRCPTCDAFRRICATSVRQCHYDQRMTTVSYLNQCTALAG